MSSLFIILFITIIPIPNTNLEITAFDVGNADSFMIKTPDNKYLMIDTGKSGYNGGKSQAEIIMLKYFIDNGIKNIDSIIITHFDDDHSGGAYDLINQLSVNKIYVNSTNHQSNSAKMIYKAAQKHGTKIIPAVRNQTVYNRNGLVITNYITDDTSSGNDNENSILTLIKYGEFSMLFMGDAGIKTFNKLKNDLPQNITVLKVGHHGAAGVISKDMADYLNTKISLFSTGENKFGHPSIYTVETLRNSNILRTDINNSIKFIVKPDCFKVQSYNSEKKRYKDVF